MGTSRPEKCIFLYDAHICRTGVGMEPPSPMNDSRDIWSWARRAQGKQGTRTRGWYASSPATWPSPVPLPGSLGLCLCLHHVHRSGRDPGARLHTARQAATVLQERDELALGL